MGPPLNSGIRHRGNVWRREPFLPLAFPNLRDSVYTLWFKTLFLPFLLSLEAGFAFAFFGSTPVGAAIGAAVGAVVSVINYVIRKTR